MVWLLLALLFPIDVPALQIPVERPLKVTFPPGFFPKEERCGEFFVVAAGLKEDTYRTIIFFFLDENGQETGVITDRRRIETRIDPEKYPPTVQEIIRPGETKSHYLIRLGRLELRRTCLPAPRAG